jgi:3-oxoacyl-[acyl-carrier-protein] synthase-3
VKPSLVGIGTWVPKDVRLNDAWPKAFSDRTQQAFDRTFNDIRLAEDPIAAKIVARDLEAESRDPFLGAVRRHVAGPEITASHAESEAAKAALADAGIAASEVDLILSNSIVPERLMPSTAAYVAESIGAKRALALGVDGACASSVVQLEVGLAYLKSGMAKVVLLTQSHLLLRAFPFEHPAAPGLGDGASAMVLALRDTGLEILSTFGTTHGEHACAVTWVRGQDDETDTPWWKAGGDYRLGSRNPERAKVLMRDTVTYGALTVQEAAKRASVDVERIAAIASVQPRGFIPHAISERLGLSRDRAVTTYERVAHLGACGAVFNLEEARARGAFEDGAIVAAYAQGSGFTRSAAVFRVHGA